MIGVFLLGLCVGAVLGFFLAAILVAARDADATPQANDIRITPRIRQAMQEDYEIEHGRWVQPIRY